MSDRAKNTYTAVNVDREVHERARRYANFRNITIGTTVSLAIDALYDTLSQDEQELMKLLETAQERHRNEQRPRACPAKPAVTSKDSTSP